MHQHDAKTPPTSYPHGGVVLPPDQIPDHVPAHVYAGNATACYVRSHCGCEHVYTRDRFTMQPYGVWGTRCKWAQLIVDSAIRDQQRARARREYIAANIDNPNATPPRGGTWYSGRKYIQRMRSHRAANGDAIARILRDWEL